MSLKKINTRAVSELLHSPEIVGALEARGAAIAARAEALSGLPSRTHQGPARYDVDVGQSTNRKRATVIVSTDSTRARVAQAAHNALLKAL
jgi:hypothetical protein